MVFKMLGWLKGKESNDEPLKEQLADFRSNPAFAANALPACESLLGGYGPFGSVTNPIPVNGPRGEISYLNQLRTEDGRSFIYHRPGSMSVDVSSHPIDGFELISKDGSERRTLWFSPYHPRRTTLTPDGLHLAPFPKEKHLQILVGLPMFGMTSRVLNFPIGLDQLVRESMGSLMPELGDRAGNGMSQILKEIRLEPQPDLHPGPLVIIPHKSDEGLFLVMVDGDEDVIDFARIDMTPPVEYLGDIIGERSAAGDQALLQIAVYEVFGIPKQDRERLARQWGLAEDDELTMLRALVMCWFAHELTGHPRVDGTYGKPAEGLCRSHWADVESAHQILSRQVRGLLNMARDRRLAEMASL